KITAETGIKFNITINTREEIKRKLKNGEGDILFNSSKTLERENLYYYLPTFKDKFTPLDKIPTSNTWVSINKNQPELFSIICKVKSSFTDEEIRKSLIKQRPIFYKTLLQNDERVLNFKKTHNSIVVLLPESKDMLPLFYKNKTGYSGYIIDRLNELSFVIGLPLVYSRSEDDNYDIRAVDSNSFLSIKSNMYIPYYKISIALFSRSSDNFVDSYKDTNNKKVGFIAREDLKPDSLKYIPKNMKYIRYTNCSSALKGILKGEIDYLYGDFKIVSMAIANDYLERDIKVSGFLGGSETIGFRIKEDVDLYEILSLIFPNQLVESSILQSELKITKRLNLDYKYFLLIFCIFTSVIGGLFYFLKKAIIASKKEQRIAKALV
ncbi:MAG: hypothetical protein ACRC34_01675, partial [Cetobacterium sp.]